jgi:phosphoglycerate dehydrogenase-like enzyme
MERSFVTRICAIALLSAASVATAADKKIVINALDNHNGWAFTEAALREYRNAGAGAAIVVAKSPADLARETVDADAVIGGIPQDLFAKASKLKWVQTYSAGVEQYRWPEFLQSPVVLTNCRIVQGPNIADHAMALLLALTRGLNDSFSDKEKERWNREGHELLELQDMTAVVIGVGGIGSQIAQRAHGFGMKVIGVDPKDLPPNVTVTRMVYPSQLDSVLPLADVVFVSAPLTPESRHMMGPAQFDLMKKSSFFVAVSRGGLYDTPSLVKALDGKKLAGAGLDVTDPEPLPKGHALWKFPNVVITPHLAGNSPGSYARRIGVFKDNITHFVRNEPFRNLVDKQKGY